VTPEATSAAISAAGFICSVAGSFFIAGSRWGEVRTKLNDLQTNRVTSSDIQSLSERMARVEGMFELKLKGPG